MSVLALIQLTEDISYSAVPVEGFRPVTFNWLTGSAVYYVRSLIDAYFIVNYWNMHDTAKYWLTI